MKRLSLEEVKSKKAVVTKLEAIKGGDAADCHVVEYHMAGGGGAIEPK